MDVTDALGFYSLTTSNITLNKERILDRFNPYSRPEHFKEVEKDKSCVFIWGDESANELLEKVISQELNHRTSVVDLIYLTLNIFCHKKVFEFFTLLKSEDIITYNIIKSETNYLQKVGMEKTKKWYEFWK